MSPLELRGELLARNTLLNILGQVLPLLVAVVALPFVVRGLGPERFGILSLAWLLLSFLGEVGVGRATTKYVAEALGDDDRTRVADVLWATALPQLLLGAAAAAAVVATTPALLSLAKVTAPLQPEARTSLYLIAAAIPCVLLGVCFRGILEAAQRFDLANAIRVPASAANYALPLVALAAGWSLPGVLALLLASRVLVAAGYYVAAAALFPELRRRPRLRRPELRQGVLFGGWTTLSSVISPILVYVDRLALSAISGVAAVAYYTPPFEVANRLLIVPGAVATTLFPAFSVLDQRDDARLQRLVWRTIKYILCIVGPGVVVLLVGARDLLHVWLGADYARQGATAFRLLALGILANAIAHIPYALLLGRGRPDLPAKFHLLELPIMLLLAWTLIGALGIPGAALAWLLRITLDTTLLLAASVRVGGLSLAAFRSEGLPQALAVLGAAALTCASLLLVPVPDAVRLALLALAGTAMLLVVWRLALGTEDRRGVRELLHRRGGIRPSLTSSGEAA